MWHIAHFKEMWCAATPGPAHERLLLADLKSMVPRLHDPLSRVVSQDGNWFNRLLFELKIDFTAVHSKH